MQEGGGCGAWLARHGTDAQAAPCGQAERGAAVGKVRATPCWQVLRRLRRAAAWSVGRRVVGRLCWFAWPWPPCGRSAACPCRTDAWQDGRARGCKAAAAAAGGCCGLSRRISCGAGREGGRGRRVRDERRGHTWLRVPQPLVNDASPAACCSSLVPVSPCLEA